MKLVWITLLFAPLSTFAFVPFENSVQPSELSCGNFDVFLDVEKKELVVSRKGAAIKYTAAGPFMGIVTTEEKGSNQYEITADMGFNLYDKSVMLRGTFLMDKSQFHVSHPSFVSKYQLFRDGNLEAKCEVTKWAPDRKN